MHKVLDNKSALNDYLNKLLFLVSIFIFFSMKMLNLNFTIIPVTGIVLYLIVAISQGRFALKSYHIWFIFVILFFATSSLWALRPKLSIWAILNQLELFIAGSGIICFCQTKKRILLVSKAAILASFILLIFILFYFDLNTLGKERLSDTEKGINGNGVAIAFTLALYAIILIQKISKPNLLRKSAIIILSFIYLTFILLTGSRTALLMLLIPIITYMFLKSKYKIIALFSIASILLIAIVAVMKIPSFYNVIGVRIVEMFLVMKTGIEMNPEADTSRLRLMMLGFEWFVEKPWFGYGINNFRVMSNNSPGFIGKNFYSHSNLVELLVGVGIVGALVYYTSIKVVIKELKKVIIENKLIKYAIISILIAVLVHEIYSMSYYEWDMQILFSFLYALIIYSQKNKVTV